MLAVEYAEYGDPSVLGVATMPEPHAGPGQIRIAVYAAGVNPVDWKVRSGGLKDLMPRKLPAIPGVEAAGVVDEVGEGVDAVAVGDEVFGLGTATSAQFAVLDHFVPKPDSLDWSQAAGLAFASETAARALKILDPSPGQTLLIDGAAGGVGSAAAQFALADGVAVIGTAGESNHAYLRSLGAEPTTYGPGLPERVAALAPNGVDAALDTVGKGSLPDLVAITGSPDRVVTVADLSAAEHGVRMTTKASAFDALAKAARLAGEGKFGVRIAAEFTLADAAKAHEISQGGHAMGKVVLRLTGV
ncbi:NADP-dependent oxidoreductase [Streptomyces sp. 35G-GA-8]|uniref:NADP-dependent oxidoreductase n=1 Tax=Streptomyces sp. 35G-GA-8 TaxID=2939434 RepID=UPI00201FA8DC|nr:NADP-dependent oxidoreductase [Streptomyces sp. 35G-GA-8]MCL7381710.1 NADP-dependent oxidoreductase [Streptomyces sp. 35G-GA-8]